MRCVPRPERPFVVPLLGLFTGLILTLSCADLISAPDKITVILPAPNDLVAIIQGVDDVSARIAGEMHGSGAPALRSALQRLSSALQSNDATAADRELTSARAALASYLAAPDFSPLEGPDLSSVDLSLTLIEQSIQRPCASRPNVIAGTSSPSSSTATGGRASLSCGGH